METQLPDVALEKNSTTLAPLDWVGMSEIEIPILLDTAQGPLRSLARVKAQVSLDRAASRGIHMSRLYLAAQKLSESLFSPSLLRKIANEFLQTHSDLSSRARLEVRFEGLIERPALKSALKAWRNYPLCWGLELGPEGEKLTLETEVVYSSTCPASAALARQLIQENFRQSFAGENVSKAEVAAWLGTSAGVLATPHAQRSVARVKVLWSSEAEGVDAFQIVDTVEDALQTAVQGAVKREDEQEFALRNGRNLMFCEDAARRVKIALDGLPAIADYVAEFNHLESLHPHNAVSLISKGLPGGLKGF